MCITYSLIPRAMHQRGRASVDWEIGAVNTSEKREAGRNKSEHVATCMIHPKLQLPLARGESQFSVSTVIFNLRSELTCLLQYNNAILKHQLHCKLPCVFTSYGQDSTCSQTDQPVDKTNTQSGKYCRFTQLSLLLFFYFNFQ